MLPFIAAGAVLFSLGTAAYRYYNTPASPAIVSLGRFAIWGRPNAGKTTFISGLMGKLGSAKKKEATTSRHLHRDVPIILDGKKYQIDEIADLPGTADRVQDWLALVASHDHVFYLINLGNEEPAYLTNVRADLKATKEALKASSKVNKRLHIIASHLDLSRLKEVDAAQVNNFLQDDDVFRRLYELTDDVKGYVYAANLTDQISFNRLLDSIIRDSHA